MSIIALLRSIISNGKIQTQETKGPDLLDSGNNELIKGNTTVNAVNELAVTNAATGGNPILSTSGSDTNISMKIQTKGSGIISVEDISISLTTVSTVTTAGAATFTAAQILGGLILRDPTGANRADLVPTAANLVAALPGAVVGSSFEFTIRNDADAAETITLTTNTGATMSGTMTIAQNNSKRFLVVLTNVTAASEAYTVYSFGTVVH